jgi:uncharacterized protein YhjY with autotransporter beta-barrel domain
MWLLMLTLASKAASAQGIVNGGFETGDFTGYQVAGVPVVSNQPVAPYDGNFEAIIQSTGGVSGQGTSNIANAVDAATLDTFLDTSLPSNSKGAPTDGEAIKQTFTIHTRAELTFYYSFRAHEAIGSDYDETGYTLNGVFTELANVNSPGVSGSYAVANYFVGLPYEKVTITLAPGTYTFGLVAYNTFNDNGTSAIFVDDLSLESLGTAFASVRGLSENQASIARDIDANSDAAGNFGKLVTGLSDLPATAPALGPALNELSPQPLQILRRIAFDDAAFNSQGLENHLTNLRDGASGFDGSQMTVTDSTAPSLSQLKGRLLAWEPPVAQDAESDSVAPILGGVDLRDSKQMRTADVQPSDRGSLFLLGNAVLADLSHRGDVAHQDYTTASVTLGADYRLAPHFVVGALLGYGHTDANLDHENSTATVDSYSPGVYAAYADAGWYANALFNYDYNSYTEDRHVAIGALSGFNHGAPQGNECVGNLTSGYEMQSGAFKYGPVGSVQYVNLGIDSFREAGPAGLAVQDESDESLRSQLGFEGRFAARVGGVVLTPRLSATWQHEFLDGDHGITSQFNGTGAGSFTVQTSATAHDSAFIDFGLDAALNADLKLFVDYEAEAGEDDFFAQSVQAGLRFGF